MTSPRRSRGRSTTTTLPYLFTAGVIGGITGTGGGANKTWAFQPTSLTSSPLGMFTEEYGDDVLTDWWQLLGGVAESFTLTGDNTMGPLQLSANLRSHSGSPPARPTIR